MIEIQEVKEADALHPGVYDEIELAVGSNRKVFMFPGSINLTGCYTFPMRRDLTTAEINAVMHKYAPEFEAILDGNTGIYEDVRKRIAAEKTASNGIITAKEWEDFDLGRFAVVLSQADDNELFEIRSEVHKRAKAARYSVAGIFEYLVELRAKAIQADNLPLEQMPLDTLIDEMERRGIDLSDVDFGGEE